MYILFFLFYSAVSNDTTSVQKGLFDSTDTLHTTTLQSNILNDTFQKTKLTVANRSIDFNSKFGEIPYQSGVSSMGARVYTVPINCYAGVEGMTPQIALTYNSMQGNGITGMGWSISGLSAGLLAIGDFSEANDMALDGALSGGVIGAATGFAGGIKYARDHKISPWTGEKTQNHHSIPKFLGGDDKQILTPMETSRHRTLHKELNEYLKTQTSDDKRYNMFPRKGNSGETIRNNFTDATRINAAKTFYDSNKWRYWDARFDFYRNNKMIWTPW